MVNIEIRVPKEMKTFLLNENSAYELRRNQDLDISEVEKEVNSYYQLQGGYRYE